MFSSLTGFSYKTVALALSFATLVGCGIKLGEEPKENKAAEVEGTACFKSAEETLKKFTAGEASDSEVGEAVDCFQKTLITFKDNVRGAEKNAYTPEEVASFLEKFKGKSVVSPAFMREFFKFKTALVGGDASKLTSTEVTAISSALAQLKPAIVGLNPHAKVIFKKWNPSSDSAETQKAKIATAKAAFGNLLKQLTGMMYAAHRSYEVDSLIGFVTEVLKMSDADPATTAKVQNAKDLILGVKYALIGEGTAIQAAEWPRVGILATELYFVLLRLHYSKNPVVPMTTAAKLTVYEVMASDLTSGIVSILQDSGKPSVTNEEIIRITSELPKLFPELLVVPELVDQIGKVKMVILGPSQGGYQAWTQDDLIKLNAQVPVLFEIARTALRSLEHYSVRQTDFREGKIKREDFLQAEAALVQAVDHLSSQIKAGYSLGDAKKLILSLKPLLKDALKLPENLDALFSLVYAAKVTLTGEPGPQLTISNIQLLARIGVRVYGHFVEFSNFVKVFKMEEKPFAENLEPVVGKLSQTLGLALSLKPTHQMTSAELTGLVLTAQEAKILNTKIKRESLMALLDTLWKNILNTPEDRLQNKPAPTGFNQQVLSNLGRELQFWLAGQKALIDIFSRKNELSKAELITELQKRIESSRQAYARAALQELHRMTSAAGQMNFNSKGYLKILTADNGRYHVSDVINSNLAKTFARLFMRAYITEVARLNDMSGITLPEAETGFNQFKNVIYDLELLSPTNTKFISGRFLEANIFLSVSNGDTMVSYEEFHHLTLHIMSGLSRASALEKIANAKCLKHHAETPMMSEFDQDCLLNVYYEESNSFADLPEFLRLRTTNSQVQNKDYYMGLLKAAGHKPNDKNTVLVKDAALFPHVVQYVEMVFDRHDTDKNAYLGISETSAAATTVFSELIFSVVKKKFKKPEYPGILINLMRCGRLPVSFSSQAKLLAFVRLPICKEQQWPRIRSSRTDVGHLLNAMSAVIGGDTAGTTPPGGEPALPPVTPPLYPEDFICNEEDQQLMCDQYIGKPDKVLNIDRLMYYMSKACAAGEPPADLPAEPPPCPAPEPPPEDPPPDTATP